VAVNLSARQLQRSSLTTEIGDVLDRTGLDAGCLSLEISESVVMEDPLSMTARLHDLRGLGIKLSLDDFGTGSTSLSQLRRFPLDVLKIDRVFVEGLGKDREDTVIVQAMLGMTKALGLSVVAEGVETEYQLSILRDLRCDLVQGFLYSKAVSADSIFELVAGPKGASALSVPGL
jgi:EAL domain-containing protein (putative c-di-GMP-specific phosphodiesterase class I)